MLSVPKLQTCAMRSLFCGSAPRTWRGNLRMRQQRSESETASTTYACACPGRRQAWWPVLCPNVQGLLRSGSAGWECAVQAENIVVHESGS